MPGKTAAKAYTLRIELQDIEPLVWRRLLVDMAIRRWASCITTSKPRWPGLKALNALIGSPTSS